MNVKDLLKPLQSPPQPPGQPPSRQRLAPGRNLSSSQTSSYVDSMAMSSASDYHPVLASPSAEYNPIQDSYEERGNQVSPVRHSQPEYRRSWEHASQHMPYNQDLDYQHGVRPSQQPIPAESAFSPEKRSSPPGESGWGPPQKKQSKWSPDEDARIIELRGSGMKWSDISKRFRGRSDIACRLHYQNYLEKRGEWDEEKKNKLARVYERLKSDLWGPIANELGIPWRAAEAMHWILGEQEMARRANVVPFTLTTAGSAGEGHGRVAKTIRMHDSTISFEASDLANLDAAVEAGGGAGGGPVSTFGPRLGGLGEGGERMLRAKMGKGDGVGGGGLPSLMELESGVSPYAYRERRGSRGSRKSGSSSEEEGRAEDTSR